MNHCIDLLKTNTQSHAQQTRMLYVGHRTLATFYIICSRCRRRTSTISYAGHCKHTIMACIWNPDHLVENSRFGTYRFILVCTSMDQYMISTLICTSMCQNKILILVCTCMYQYMILYQRVLVCTGIISGKNQFITKLASSQQGIYQSPLVLTKPQGTLPKSQYILVHTSMY